MGRSGPPPHTVMQPIWPAAHDPINPNTGGGQRQTQTLLALATRNFPSHTPAAPPPRTRDNHGVVEAAAAG